MTIIQDELSELRNLKNGDVRAFNRIYERYHTLVHANIFKFVKSSDLSVEVLQDVFLTLWQNRHKIETDKPIDGWLFVVSHNKSLNVLRKQIRQSIEYISEIPTELEQDVSQETVEEVYEKQLEILLEAVDELPNRKKEVFMMCRYQGYSKDHVAEKLGLSPRSIKNYLKDANKSIRRYIAKNHPKYMEQLGGILLFLTMNDL